MTRIITPKKLPENLCRDWRTPIGVGDKLRGDDESLRLPVIPAGIQKDQSLEVLKDCIIEQSQIRKW